LKLQNCIIANKLSLNCHTTPVVIAENYWICKWQIKYYFMVSKNIFYSFKITKLAVGEMGSRMPIVESREEVCGFLDKWQFNFLNNNFNRLLDRNVIWIKERSSQMEK
jgi:hypothetical protein